MYSSTTSVTSAQIKALDTPVQLVAGIPGKMIYPLGGSIELIAGTIAYVDHSATLAFDYTSGATPWWTLPAVGFIDQTINYLAPVVVGHATFDATQSPLLWEGYGMYLWNVGAPGSNPTAGNGTLSVNLLYAVLDLV